MTPPPRYSVQNKDSFFEKNWVLILGVFIGCITLFFLMALVIMSVFSLTVPAGSRFIVITIIAFGLAFASAFIGGNAAANGKIPFLPEKLTVGFSAGGGIAAFLIVFILGSYLYIDDGLLPKSWDGKFNSLKKVDAQISNVDDSMIVRVNEKQIAEISFGETPPTLDILPELRKGENVIEVQVRNGSYGGCSGKLKLIFNDMAIPDYQWSVDNKYAAIDSICYSQKKNLKIQ
ncbi:hypothetical protein [Pseudomonas sp. F01002]|uniref:hypothetical protein n=1 Tax=Pseudomonas sp. F01002 TaxID=2555724 RepID=UPI00106A30BB|nr:hypothetical protein [Pseudomonas sp. F01002]TFB39021.1 hypothetical protein E3W21_17720 [Pseudomonas sp. F01002]